MDRRHLTGEGPVDTTWSPALAYAVGLIATDGNLSPNHRAVRLVSADRDLLETFKRCIPRAGRIGRHGPNAWHTTVSSVAFYRWLEGIGLTPKKSLTMGALAVPDDLLIDLTRGLMDGDGSIRNYVHHPGGNVRRYPEYRYERLELIFHSASRSHLTWLQCALQKAFAVSGSIAGSQVTSARPHPMYRLKYGKTDSTSLLTLMYRVPSSPRLERKWLIWEAYLTRGRR